MFVYQLLFSFGFHDHCKVVKRLDNPAYLKPVYEINDDRDIFLANLVQKRILNIDLRFVHALVPPSSFISTVFANRC